VPLHFRNKVKTLPAYAMRLKPRKKKTPILGTCHPAVLIHSQDRGPRLATNQSIPLHRDGYDRIRICGHGCEAQFEVDSLTAVQSVAQICENLRLDLKFGRANLFRFLGWKLWSAACRPAGKPERKGFSSGSGPNHRASESSCGRIAYATKDRIVSSMRRRYIIPLREGGALRRSRIFRPENFI